MFSRSPRGGPAKALDPSEISKMNATLQGAGIGPLIVHCPYYVLPAHDNPEVGALATQIIAEDLARAKTIGASYVVVHAGHSRAAGSAAAGSATAGSAAAASAVADRVSAAIDRFAGGSPPEPGDPVVLIENGAGGRGDAAATMATWALCIQGVAARGLPVGGCMDTAHLWGAGWELGDDPAERLLAGLASLGMLDRLRVIHFNDSSAAPGSRRDRHEHIGEGVIPEEVFCGLLRSPLLCGRSGIVETDPENGGVARDIAALRRLRDQPPPLGRELCQAGAAAQPEGARPR
jgi:deoxyribonuclease-4